MAYYARVVHHGVEKYAAVMGERIQFLSGSFFDPAVVPTGEEVPSTDVQWLAPVRPRTVLAVGRNYREHAKELGNAVPDAPLLFLKQPGTITGHGADILYPSGFGRIDYEGELVIVIGQAVNWQTPKEAIAGAIFGYTIGNDVTARELQKQDGQWTRAKGFDTFGPLGPVVATAYDYRPFRIETRVNGEIRQQGAFSDMIFDPESIVFYASRFMTLQPGDVIFSGTPEGVGPVQPGDLIEITIQGIGKLSNRVKTRE
ncbi:fumarylacetoacetate hydrolase family protein [Sulfobacillus sp. hq2]|nr:fumarylacetoacetate hydrolase family protein [Sulfobacillus sp. hq2]